MTATFRLNPGLVMKIQAEKGGHDRHLPGGCFDIPSVVIINLLIIS